MIYEKKLANAVGSKTARACDSCLRRRARWYCAADDAFLCQGCDASVHSANPLARRHERIRLKSASLKPSDDASVEGSLPAWHQGFTRKARTPRHGKPTVLQSPKIEEPMLNPFPLVPDMGSDEPSLEENEEQLLYRVPIFDPFMEEFCTSTSTPNEAAATANDATTEVVAGSVDNLSGFLPSDIDLAEFAADVESLLGRGLDEDSFGMEGLGLLVSKEEDAQEFCLGSGRAKVEEEEREDVKDVVACQVDPELDMAREPLDLKFEYDSPTTAEEGEKDKVVAGSAMVTMNSGYKTEEMTRRILLKLDYEAVIIAWASQGSPWITGERPQLNPDDCWLDLPVTIPAGVQHQYGDLGGHMGVGDGGREARVSRYREKRRTRLFSKKIRYEVRRLNAEKRPRMKGRFVKRESFAGTVFPF